ncbi:hemerythrin domain-containing protein [Castellaniella sp. GW247-6E4]|uniref:hemerythrin domain-containing protein n=1 Tax=Castellaniella sp. GW247-6E4 TaxID=3140380 RepID=UPI0033147601
MSADEEAAAGSPRGQPAPRIPAIEIIREEHRALAAVLQCMTYLIDEIEAGRLEPDFKLLASMIEYISEMPDKVHHPKEDQIFARLRQYTHEVDAHLDQLEAEHAGATQATAAMDRALVHYVQAGAAGFALFRDAVRAYIADEWVHLGKEERYILPAAQRFLAAEDWETINRDFGHNGDPWRGEHNQYAELFKRIANLAPAPIGLGEAPAGEA